MLANGSYGESLSRAALGGVYAGCDVSAIAYRTSVSWVAGLVFPLPWLARGDLSSSIRTKGFSIHIFVCGSHLRS